MELLPDDLVLYIWRFSNYRDLSGRGGLVADGRWHTRGRAIVYCADEPLTALTEVLRRISGATFALPDTHMMLKVRVPIALRMHQIGLEDLPAGWRAAGPIGWSTCQMIGDAWLQECVTALLKVPSAARPGAFNFLLNPVHRDADRIKVIEVIRYPETMKYLD
jgi:RES domain-containing protein